MSGVTKVEKKSVVKVQNTVNKKNIHESLYRYLLKAHIGPDDDKLINAGEAAIDAYHRHQDIIKSLPTLRTAGDVIKRIEEYPYYFGQHIIKGDDLIRIIPNMRMVAEYVVAVHEMNRGDELIKPVIESILNLEEEKDFFKFFSSIGSFSYFLEAFPQYASFAMRRVFANNFCLNAIFSNKEKVRLFKEKFPQHMEEAESLRDGVFKKMESKRVESPHEESQFLDLLRRTVGSDVDALINKGETAYDACFRYGDVYFDLQRNPVKTGEGFIKILLKYPHCYIDFLVERDVFKSLFNSMKSLDGFCKHVQNKEIHISRVVEFIFELDDDYFGKIFSSSEDIFYFLQNFSEKYADEAMKRVLGSHEMLNRIFSSFESIKTLIKHFRRYENFAISLVENYTPETDGEVLELQAIKELLKRTVNQRSMEQKATKNPDAVSESEALSGLSSSLSSAAVITVQLSSVREFKEEAQANDINKNGGKENYQSKKTGEKESSGDDNSDASSASSSSQDLAGAEKSDPNSPSKSDSPGSEDERRDSPGLSGPSSG